MSLRVALNLIFLGDRAGGVGRYARGLLGGLAELPDPPRLTAYAGKDLPDAILGTPWAGEIEWVRLPVGPEDRLNLVAQMVALPALAARRRFDLLHSPANVGPLLVPGVATVLTLHDLIWLHYPADWDASWRVRLSTRTLSLRSARAATRVLADSQAARQDFTHTIRLDPAKIDVAPLAADGGVTTPLPEAVLRKRLGLGDRPFVLSVAQKRRYKRLDACIRAIAELDDESPALVLVGPPTPHERELRELALTAGVPHRVLFLDWVSEDELESLYRACSCFVLPSLIEGFGLPVLEAMWRGTPVACSNRSSLPEVTGDATLLFDPLDQAQVTGAIRRLLADAELRHRLSRRGREQAQRFSWRRTAEATLAAYERAVASRRTH